MKIQFSNLRILTPAVVFLLLAMGGKSVSVPVIPNECIVEGTVAEYAIVSSRLISIEPEKNFLLNSSVRRYRQRRDTQVMKGEEGTGSGMLRLLSRGV
jgi:hypothetical protein